MPATGREPNRPSPDALLEAARREERTRGRLKVFLGAAPGVGKTYEMLTVGRARLNAGADVLTVLNIQHVESLNDVVASITRIRVRETVPDGVLDAALPAEAKAEPLATIIEESGRLNRSIANLLDMTRLEAGAVAPNLTDQDVAETVDTALRRTQTILAGHRVAVEVEPDLPTLRLDPVLFERVLVNLLDNAAKYAPEGSTVTIRARREGDAVRLAVRDEGNGIPEAEVERVFDKFCRARKGDRVRAGTGLGLAIARGFVEAMGGTLAAANRRDRAGAAFTVTLPVPERRAARGIAA